MLILMPLVLLIVIPSLVVVLVLACLIVRFRIYRWTIFRWLNFPAVVISIPLIALAFGIATGYFEAWIDHQYWEAGGSQRWYDMLGFPGWPGDMIANEFWGDWQQDEEWDYRDKVALWNGCFWTATALASLPLIYLIYRNSVHPSMHSAQLNSSQADEVTL